MNGKGDAPRKMNGDRYRENFDYIKWNRRDPVQRESHLAFMRSQGFLCATEDEAYELRGLLDM
jgi:hypothetical protein